MAGAGYKAWSAGDVLTASDVNTYLMQQSVMTFAGTAARASAVAAPSEGMLSYRTDENVLETFDGSQWVPSTAMTPTSLTGRNLLYNGAMQVAQRGTAVTNITTSTNAYNTADRWAINLSSLGTWSQTIEADAPTGSGFRNSLKMTCGTADASPAASDKCFIEHRFEGQDLQRIRKGTSSAQQLTLSFWVKSNLTGTFIAELYDVDNARQVSKAYTISAGATWEKKTITFPADTTGAFDNDNAHSLSVQFGLGAGSDFTSGTLNTSWASATNANRYVGQTNVAGTNANYWQITGVQLELGPAATPFEFEPFETTLRKCQRYYEKTYGISVAPGTSVYEGIANVHGTTNAGNTIQSGMSFMCAKRTGSYTLKGWTVGGVANQWSCARSGIVDTGTTVYFTQASEHGFSVYVNIGLSWTNSIMYGHWTCDAEL